MRVRDVHQHGATSNLDQEAFTGQSFKLLQGIALARKATGSMRWCNRAQHRFGDVHTRHNINGAHGEHCDMSLSQISSNHNLAMPLTSPNHAMAHAKTLLGTCPASPKYEPQARHGPCYDMPLTAPEACRRLVLRCNK